MKNFYLFFAVISVAFRCSMCNSDYGMDGIDGYGTSGSAQFCADLNPQNQLDITQVRFYY